MRREGSYPPPPHWPERLTEPSTFPDVMNVLAIVETSEVTHTYLADGWPGPCRTAWKNDSFAGWWPTLTIERAEKGAAR